MPKRWLEIPDVELPTVDVDNAPFALIRVNLAWKTALLSLVQHADNVQFWAGNPDPDRVEQNAYKLFQAIRKGAGMIGAIVPFASTNAPAGTLLCDGNEHNKADYPALFAVLPPHLKIDSNRFITPDLRGLFIIGASNDYPNFDEGGEARHTLTIDEMPSHTHTNAPHAHSESGALTTPGEIGPGVPFAYATATLNTTGATSITIDHTGAGEAHNNLPPYIALAYAIVAE